MNAQVVCHVRAGVTLTFKLKEKDAVVGRDPLNAIAVPIEGVSRHHAKIRWDGKAYWVEDLRSTNGTFLNGQTAMRERLKHLDVISLGREVDLVFVARAAEAPQIRQGIVRAALVAEGEGGVAVAISTGEVTLGRAPSNNIVADPSAVSKVHARIERTLDQLVLEDLGSANGTYVNGARVMTAFLHDGDVLSLAGVETYRVVVEMGEVKGFSTSARMKAPVNPGERHRFAADWRTRFDWDSGEQKQLEELRHQIRERDKLREKQRERTHKVDVVKAPGHPARSAAPAKAAPAKPAPAKPVVPAVPAKP
ncbi:MAG TPA: FHA domain-containing protein, partial [Candidatus Thermoplasmatota archaeon]